MKRQNALFSQNEKIAIIKICRSALVNLFKSPNNIKIEIAEVTPILKQPYGAFVTLYKNGQLRGCIGRFSTEEPLYKTLKEMTRSSALNDYRFNPVEMNEVDQLEIEVSVLTPLERIWTIDDFTLGKHGIYIKKGMHTGTFLPQVAKTTNWNIDEFLGHCSRDKAGIGWHGWKDAELFRYEAIVIREKDFEFPK